VAEEKKIIKTRDINLAIKKKMVTSRTITISGLTGQDSVAVGINKDVELVVNGTAGDLFGALNGNSIITLNGNAGRFLGDSMCGGGIIVNGDVGKGCGHASSGGIIVIRGKADSTLGQLNRGGTIIVEKGAGDRVGAGMFQGDIIVVGGCGNATGDWAVGGSIFVEGDIGGIGKNMEASAPTGVEKKKIQTYLNHYGVKGELENFVKIAPLTDRPFTKNILLSQTIEDHLEVETKEDIGIAEEIPSIDTTISEVVPEEAQKVIGGTQTARPKKTRARSKTPKKKVTKPKEGDE